MVRRGSDPTQARCLSCHAVHGAAAEPLLRAADEASACVACHPDQLDADTNHVLGRVPGRDLAATGQVHLVGDGGVGCLTCHDLTSAGSAIRSLPTGEPVCLGCHADREALSAGPHGSLDRDGAPACVACHDLHGGSRADRFVVTSCGTCHGADRGAVGHPVTAGATCADCHDAHAPERPTSDACAACHPDPAGAGGHGTADCLDCHPAHRAPPAFAGENPASARCLACHAPTRAAAGTPAVRAYAHPRPVFLPGGERWTPLAGLVLYGGDGAPVPAGENGDLTCRTCHVVHGPDGSADHLRRADGWQEACTACHGDDALVMYRYFHDPARRASLLGGTP
jgi:predicted CXXCH cytochrome family protein